MSNIIDAKKRAELEALANEYNGVNNKTDLASFPSDHRKYCHLVLPNGLRILLIENNRSQKASAHLNVEAGSLDEPDTFPGLAHFLEHMVFQGSKKYPDVSEYQTFIQTHGGSYNGYTMDENTEFTFSIGHEHFENALDRLSEFFTNPTLNEAASTAEMKIVHEEFERYFSQDAWCLAQIKKMLTNPDHPGHRFMVGNNSTLKFSLELMQALRAFHKEHYVANKMILILESNFSLKEMEAFATKYFSAVPKLDAVPKKRTLPLRYLPDSLNVRIQYESKEKDDYLALEFVFTEKKSTELLHALHFISLLLNNPSPGALKDLLTERGWIKEISAKGGSFNASYGIEDDAQVTFRVGFPITELGQKQIPEIIDLTLKYINFLQKECVDLTYFKEFRDVALLNNQYSADTSNPNFMLNLRKYSLDKFFTGSNIVKESVFPESLIKKVLGYFKQENMRQIVFQSEALTEDSVIVEPYMKGKYIKKPLDLKVSKELEQIAFKKPEYNPYIPEKFELIQKTDKRFKTPQIILDEDGIRCWYSQDYKFKVPKVSTMCILESNALKDTTIEEDTAIGIYSILFNQALQKHLQRHISIANSSVEIESTKRGIVIKLIGFSDKHNKIFMDIINLFAGFKVEEDDFESAKAMFIEYFQKKTTDPILEQGFSFVDTLLDQNDYSTEACLKVLQEISLEFLNNFAQKCFSNLKLELYSHGNMNAEDVIYLARNIQRTFKCTPGEHVFGKDKLIHLNNGVTYIYNLKNELGNNLLCLFLQAPDRFYMDFRVLNILAKIIHPKFFAELRTREELAYAAGCVLHAVGDEYPGLVFYIESSKKDVNFLINRTLTFLLNPKLLDISEIEFNKIKKSLNKLFNKQRTKFSSLQHYSGFFETLLTDGNYNFENSLKLRNVYEDFSLERLKEFYATLIQENTRKMVIIRADKATPAIAGPTIEAAPAETMSLGCSDPETLPIQIESQPRTPAIEIQPDVKMQIERLMSQAVTIDDIQKYKASQKNYPQVHAEEVLEALQETPLNSEIVPVTTVLTFYFGNYQPLLPRATAQKVDEKLRQSHKKSI